MFTASGAKSNSPKRLDRKMIGSSRNTTVSYKYKSLYDLMLCNVFQLSHVMNHFVKQFMGFEAKTVSYVKQTDR